MFAALLVMTGIALALGLALGYAAVHFHVEGNPLAEQIDATLPQTQCAQCGYPGCKQYAEALASGAAEINLCTPGGDDGAKLLAELLGREFKPRGVQEEKLKTVAQIDEQTCIGCTLCIQACPVDAIVGSAKQMHTVVIAICTGCELCLSPCPVNCISLIEEPRTPQNWRWKYPKTGLKVVA